MLGTSLKAGIGPTLQIYQPMLDKNAEAILATEKETFSYGSNPRQVLDIYYPSKDNARSGPVLIFFYGGNLNRGSRNLPFVNNGLVYANLGHFFSKLGYITIIPDYRLVPEAKFPSGGEDVLAALEWTDERFSGQGRGIFLMGHSAGGVHISTFILADMFESKRRGLVRAVGGLKGAVLLSVPFSFGAALESRTETLHTYFGSDIDCNSPMGLLKAFDRSGAALSIPTLILTSALDPIDEIIDPSREFGELYEKLSQKDGDRGIYEARVIDGHNHVSTAFALGTAKTEEEAWAVEAHEWMNSMATNR